MMSKYKRTAVPPTDGARKSFIFPAAALRRLDGITWVCRMKSHSEVIRLALMVLEELVVAGCKGRTIIIRDKDGSERIYDPLYEVDNGGETENADIMQFVDKDAFKKRRAA